MLKFACFCIDVGAILQQQKYVIFFTNVYSKCKLQSCVQFLKKCIVFSKLLKGFAIFSKQGVGSRTKLPVIFCERLLMSFRWAARREVERDFLMLYLTVHVYFVLSEFLRGKKRVFVFCVFCTFVLSIFLFSWATPGEVGRRGKRCYEYKSWLCRVDNMDDAGI